MIEGKRTGIPTTYGGVEFRSRLEAKWAAFFDLVGWKWTYEPLDYPGWIPDFMLAGARRDGTPCGVLVEVKPEHAWPATEAELATIDTPYEILLVGEAPFMRACCYDACDKIGRLFEQWVVDPPEGRGAWQDAAFGWYQDKLGFSGDSYTYGDRISGREKMPSRDPGYGGELWRKAGNITQWHSGDWWGRQRRRYALR